MIHLLLAWQVAAAMPHLQQGDFAGARPYLEKACLAKEANACYLLGRTLFTLDLYDDALKVLAPLRATDPAPWRVDDAIGLTYEGMRRPADAEKSYRNALTGNALSTPDPAHHFGRFLTREGRATEAIVVLQPAARKFPNHRPIHFELGRALYYLDRFSEAEAALTKALPSEEAQRLLEKCKRRK